MSHNKVLITGASGFIGGRLLRDVARHYNTIATQHIRQIPNLENVETFQLDITNSSAVQELIRDIRPSVVIHAAGYTRFDSCEADRVTAWRVNVLGTENIAKACEDAASRMIYLSSDLVHDGKNAPYSESDSAFPICVYGETKLAGELSASKFCKNLCIVRPSLTYGLSVNNAGCFSEIIIRNIQQRKRTNLFIDEFRTPIYLNDLSESLIKIIQKENICGIINICGPERLSRYEFGLKAVQIFESDTSMLVPISVMESEYGERRPKDCSLSNDLAKSVFGFTFSGVDDSLKRLREDMAI